MSARTLHEVPVKWDAEQIPSQRGRLAVVTGANSGVGFVTALELARHGADVVLACRSDAKGQAAAERISEAIGAAPDRGSVRAMRLDVSSLASVARFSEALAEQHERLDLLVNNAGVMAIPFKETADGLDEQFATNHLGHFVLTSRLLPLLRRSTSARVVNVSSLVHRDAEMDARDIMMRADGYRPMAAYANSKLCNVLFTLELARRLQASGVANVAAVCAHPGITRTNLFTAPAATSGCLGRLGWGLFARLPLFQTAEMGALPQLYAATAADLASGAFVGPDGGRRGYPALETPSSHARSETMATAMWEQSERLARLTFEVK